MLWRTLCSCSVNDSLLFIVVVLLMITTHECSVVMFSVTPSVSVCLTVCDAVSFESLDLEIVHVCFAATSSEYLGHVHISGSSGQGQGHRSKKTCLCMLFVGGLPSIERQYYYY